PGDERRYCLHIPVWMFDAATCACMQLEPQPFVCLEALGDLRSMLDVALENRSPALHNRHVPDTPGGVDASEENRGTAGPSCSDEPIPSTESIIAELEPHAGSCQRSPRGGSRAGVAPRQRHPRK